MAFFNPDRLKETDKLLIIIYGIISVIVFSILFLFRTGENRMILFIYLMITHFSIYGVFCRGLKYVRGNLFWISMSGIHIVLYYLLKDKPELIFNEVSAAIGLTYTWAFVVVLNLSRLLSILVFRRELVTIFSYGQPLFGNEKPVLSDWLFLVPNIVLFIYVLQLM